VERLEIQALMEAQVRRELPVRPGLLVRKVMQVLPEK
jgi:hypothetical protein